jgi:hypothetical protein
VVRLGSVVGAILSELAQARAVADHATRELVAEYDDDPILATFPVPRVSLETVNVTLRFTVDDVDEPEPVRPDAAVSVDKWTSAVTQSLRTVVGRRLPRDQIDDVVGELLTSAKVTATTMSRILDERDAGLLGDETTEAALDAWTRLPTEVRRALGGKTEFRKSVREHLVEEGSRFLRRIDTSQFIQQALTSKMVVAITSSELPDEPTQIQELSLTIGGADLDVLVTPAEET